MMPPVFFATDLRERSYRAPDWSTRFEVIHGLSRISPRYLDFV